jgi:hypothetical protein
VVRTSVAELGDRFLLGVSNEAGQALDVDVELGTAHSREFTGGREEDPGLRRSRR